MERLTIGQRIDIYEATGTGGYGYAEFLGKQMPEDPDTPEYKSILGYRDLKYAQFSFGEMSASVEKHNLKKIGTMIIRRLNNMDPGTII